MGSSFTTRSIRPPRRWTCARMAPGAVTLLLAAALCIPGTLDAQQARTVRGTVIDAGTQAPVEGVLVRATGTEARALTDAEGAFRLDGVPTGTRTFVLQRIGYGVVQVELDPPTDAPVTFEIEPRPVALPGLDAEARSFRARMDSISTFMDRNAFGRYWASAYTNMPRVAGIEEMREVHHLDDPELALRALGVSPALDQNCSLQGGIGVVGRFSHDQQMRSGGGPRETLVYIDGESYGQDGLGCDRMRGMDTSSICRMELFHVPDKWLPDYRLRVWTCAFLARLAADDQPVPEMTAPAILWPDLMGPGGG